MILCCSTPICYECSFNQIEISYQSTSLMIIKVDVSNKIKKTLLNRDLRFWSDIEVKL